MVGLLGYIYTSSSYGRYHISVYWVGKQTTRKEAGLQEENAGALAGWERPGHRVWWPKVAAASRLSEAVRRRVKTVLLRTLRSSIVVIDVDMMHL